MNATIQIFRPGRWTSAVTLSPDRNSLSKGIAGSGVLEYDIEYVVKQGMDDRSARVALGYPVNFELYRRDGGAESG
jgi:hypothetical protein